MKKLLLLALLALTACPEKKKSVPPPSGPQPSAAWLKGELPPSVNEGTPKKGGVLSIRTPIEPAGLSRLHDQMVEGSMIRYTCGPVYESLAELDRATHPNYKLKPVLAESWVESDDHLTITLKLRHGVKFHDGSPFTSKDVLATLEVIRDPQNLTAALRSSLNDLKEVTAPDEFTVIVTWNKPYFLATHELLAAIPIYSAKSLKGDFNTLPVHRSPNGTGPFKFSAWESGKSISFVRNDAYWGTPALLDGYTLQIAKDETVATQRWERGEFDLMTRIQPAVWRAIEKPAAENAWAINGYHRISFVENNYGWIGWNEERPMFKDARVRRALAMLYPADKVSSLVDLGIERPTTCPYYPFSNSCDPQVKAIAYEPKAAMALLEEAGWKDSDGDGVREKDGKPLHFSFLVVATSVKFGKLGPLLQEEFRKAGVEMEIEKIDASLAVSRLRAHEFDAASLSWSTNELLRDQYSVFHSSEMKGSNFVSYSNEKVDRLLEQIRATLDDPAREALERQVHRALYEDQVYLFLTNRPSLDAVKTDVKGIAPSLGWYDLRKIWLDRPEKH